MYKKYKFCLARNSLKYLIKTFCIKELYLPYYLCDVVRHSVVEAGCKPLFYHIDDNFMPTVTFDSNSFILYPNYFGVCDKNVEYLEKLYPKLIVDNAHAYYAQPRGFACFNSERKFKNVFSGSYLWIKENGEPRNCNNSEILPNNHITHFIYLHKKYSDSNLLKFDINFISSPFCYPFLADTDIQADNLAYELQKQGKTIYRYWNNLPETYNEYKFYRRLVPIPLDK